MLDAFLTAFASLLAVASILPYLPVVTAYTAELRPRAARRYQQQALVGGYLVGFAFLLGAPLLFGALGIGLDDLRVAGGAVLLVFAIHDLLFSRAQRKEPLLHLDEDGGADNEPSNASHDVLGHPVAPLGTPMIVGPGVLSLLLVLAGELGTGPVALAFGANFALNAVLLRFATPLLDALGEGFGRAVGKVMSLVLAALGAAMLRAGIGL